MEKQNDKDILKMEIKSMIKDIISGRTKVKGIDGKERYEVYYLREEEIKELCGKLVKYWELSGYVRNIIFRSYNPEKGPSVLAHYKNSDRVIYYDYLKGLSRLKTGKPYAVTNNPKFAGKVNTRMLATLFHEMIHASQLKIALSISWTQDQRINELYRIMYVRKKELVEQGIYKPYYYRYNPIEREAFIKSNKLLRNLIMEIKNDLAKNSIGYLDEIAYYDGLINYLNKQMLEYMKDGYNLDDPLHVSPFMRFMKNANPDEYDFCGIENSFGYIMDTIKNDNVGFLSFEDKLTFGFPINDRKKEKKDDKRRTSKRY